MTSDLSELHGLSLPDLVHAWTAETPAVPVPRPRWWALTRHAAPAPTPKPDTAWTPRSVLALVKWFSDESATAASMAGGPHHRGWGMDRYMLRALHDTAQWQTTVLLKANSGKKSRRVPTPKPWPGPDELRAKAEQKRPKMTVADLARLNKQTNRRR